MFQEKKIILQASNFPKSSCFAIMLLFNDELFQSEALLSKNLHEIETKWDDAPLLSHVPDENCAKFSFF